MNPFTLGSRISVSAGVLAGGRASRYGGACKGLLEVSPGVTILDRILEGIRESGVADIVILANDRLPYEGFGLPVVPDLRPGLGPVAGIEAALYHFHGLCDAVLFLPCDLPGITRGEIETLLSAHAAGSAAVVYAGTPFHEEPLCAVVRSSILSDVSRAVEHGVRKVSDLWRELGGMTVQFDDPAPFFNINSPGEFDRWLHGGDDE